MSYQNILRTFIFMYLDARHRLGVVEVGSQIRRQEFARLLRTDLLRQVATRQVNSLGV